jgi:hypothetical protein
MSSIMSFFFSVLTSSVSICIYGNFILPVIAINAKTLPIAIGKNSMFINSQLKS